MSTASGILQGGPKQENIIQADLFLKDITRLCEKLYQLEFVETATIRRVCNYVCHKIMHSCQPRMLDPIKVNVLH